MIEALETGGVLLLDELDDADVYIDDDECPQCGRVLGISTSTGNSVCDNCGWGHSDTTEDDEAPVIVTEDTIVNEGDLTARRGCQLTTTPLLTRAMTTG